MVAGDALGIGPAAARVGVPAHVLRHWESMGVVSPERTRNGHRSYTAAQLAQIRLVQRCQAAGLSLSQVRSILSETGPTRRDMLAAHQQSLHIRASHVAAALALVGHALECTHPSLVECPGCRAALSDGPSAPAGAPVALTAEGLAFVQERHLATFTSVRGDGRPHVTPVGFTWEPERGMARVITSGTSRKARNVAAGRPVVLCQVDGRRWLALEGGARVATDPRDVAEAVTRYTTRYRVPRENPARVAIEIQVTHVFGSPQLRTAG